MADSIEQNKVAFKEQYPDAPDDAIHAWATIKYNEDVKEEALTYADKRFKEYPSLQDCIHALLDGGDTLTDLQAARQAVKDKYPKG